MMRKTRVLLFVAIGLSMLISIFSSGISLASHQTYALSLPGNSMASLNLFTSSSCMLCHETPNRSSGQDDYMKNYSSQIDSLQDQLFSKVVITHHSSSEYAIALNPETIYAILTAPHTGQSIRMQDFTGPIIQCGFCHSHAPVQASTAIGETE
jgi:hypothetical protein